MLAAAVAVTVAVLLGVLVRARSGRFRGSTPVPTVGGAPGAGPVHPAPGAAAVAAAAVAAADLPRALVAAAGATLGARATLLQLSSSVCAPCRATRVRLAQVAAEYPDVVHVEVDVAEHLDAARVLRVLRTPTVLVLDAAGRERGRASGAPSLAAARAALAAVPAGPAAPGTGPAAGSRAQSTVPGGAI